MPESPPDLSLSHGDEHCGTCRSYDTEQAVCLKFGNYPVEPDLVCDSWVEDPDKTDQN